ncbi:MAG: aspartate--tRNA(Asn) ligase [Candidatus Micrarchaeota archaeon]|nr:aspartate--tRNA(Asn) ligase [Candidatus Micrarchaeota archaeon]
MDTSYRDYYVSELGPEMDGKEVRIAGWVHEVRNIGKIVFLILRDHSGLAQVIAKEGTASEKLMKEMNLPKESVIAVRGKVKKNSESKYNGIEIEPSELMVLNPLSSQIPFEVTGKVPADIEVRLDNRHIDLRRLETTSVFNIQSTILNSFRSTAIKAGFNEIRTPSIVEAATEGGADLFGINYFEKTAFLAQSPQLYKQLAVVGGMDRVFMVVPVFRAEKHNTVYHLNEITQMDMEMGFADHNDAIAMLKKVVKNILADVSKRNADDLRRLGIELKKGKIIEITYKKAVSKLNSNGIKIEFGQDFNREHEEMLCGLLGEMVVVKEYPSSIRAFYSMPNQKDKEICNSFDMLYKGLEISSGAQRIHLPDVLIQSITARGLDPSNFDFYINAFRQGAPPHAGWSLGLERLTMKITGMSNIRECSMFPRDRVRLKP